METEYLESLVTIVELGSMAAAARHLNLTPASLAKRMRVLEEAVGAPLIVRSGRTVQPTESGLRILERSKAILRDVADLKSVASADDLPGGPLRLGTTPSALTQILPPALSLWAQRFPDIEIYIEPDTTEILYAKVQSGHLDAAVLVRQSFDLPKTFSWFEVRKEPLVLLASSQCRVVDVLETLRREPLIRYSRNVVGGRLADQYLREHKLQPRTRFELDGMEAITKLVEENLGVALLPDWLMGSPVSPRLRKYALPGAIPSRSVGMLLDLNSVRCPLARKMLGMLKGQPL